MLFIGALIVTISVTLLLPTTCNTIAFAFIHRKRKGTDRPNYLLTFKFFANVADLYSDVIWSLTLLGESSDLAIYAMIFTFGPHILSIAVATSFVAKWRATRSKLYVSGYGEKYGRFVLLCSVLAGFYATAELATSHLFHLGAFSLYIGRTQLESIRLLRILNVALLENLPLLILQTMYLLTESEGQSLNITVITIMFSSLSIISGVATIIAMGCSHCIKKEQTPLSSRFVWFVESCNAVETLKTSLRN